MKSKNVTEEKENIELTDETENVETSIEITKEEIEAINNRAIEAEEKAVRAQAELVNYRKRKDEEVSKILKYSNESLVLELLPILDNFERAIKMSESLTSDETINLLNGMKMVYASLISTLEKFNVKEIEALGKTFDASLHQAVMTESVEDKEKEVILEVYQKGYILKDKLLRPAMVKVNK